MDIVRRGYEPKDAVEFSSTAQKKLKTAAEEICYLLNRGYDIKSSTVFVGNHYMLSERQRLALARVTTDGIMQKQRLAKEINRNTPPKKIWMDGFNTIITLEVALSGSLLVEGMDGTIRDLAGLRGTYRIVDKTEMAVELLLAHLKRLDSKEVVIYLDQPVSNSGRLKSLILNKACQGMEGIQVELLHDVDRRLYGCESVVTTDAIILNKCKSWYNLGREIIENSVKDAWIVKLF